MLTSVVRSSPRPDAGRGVAAPATQPDRAPVRCGDRRDAACGCVLAIGRWQVGGWKSAWTRLSLAVGKRSLNWGFGNRSSNEAPERLRIGGQRAGAWRLAALRENERQRHKRRCDGEPSASGRDRARHATLRSRSWRSARPTQRRGPRDHMSGISDWPRPSTHCPNIHRRSAYFSSLAFTVDVKFPGKLPTPGHQGDTRNRVAIVGQSCTFRNAPHRAADAR